MSADTLETLPAGICDCCGESVAIRYEAGDNVCAPCYADAVGHGRMFDSVEDASAAVADALGRSVTPRETALIAAYF